MKGISSDPRGNVCFQAFQKHWLVMFPDALSRNLTACFLLVSSFPQYPIRYSSGPQLWPQSPELPRQPIKGQFGKSQETNKYQSVVKQFWLEVFCLFLSRSHHMFQRCGQRDASSVALVLTLQPFKCNIYINWRISIMNTTRFDHSPLTFPRTNSTSSHSLPVSSFFICDSPSPTWADPVLIERAWSVYQGPLP